MAVPRETRQKHMDRSSPGRTGLLRLALLLFSVAIALIAFEIGLRLTNDTPWYERLAEEQLESKIRRFPVGDKKFMVRRPLLE
ncbi:MAG: hypothetical protein VCB42_06555, partial [Myxococcota bacterium]